MNGNEIVQGMSLLLDYEVRIALEDTAIYCTYVDEGTCGGYRELRFDLAEYKLSWEHRKELTQWFRDVLRDKYRCELGIPIDADDPNYTISVSIPFAQHEIIDKLGATQKYQAKLSTERSKLTCEWLKELERKKMICNKELDARILALLAESKKVGSPVKGMIEYPHMPTTYDEQLLRFYRVEALEGLLFTRLFYLYDAAMVNRSMINGCAEPGAYFWSINGYGKSVLAETPDIEPKPFTVEDYDDLVSDMKQEFVTAPSKSRESHGRL